MLLRLALADSWGVPAFLVLVVADLLVPVVAERRGAKTWHPHQIAERCQLFTLIVLGEVVLSTSVAIQSGVDPAGNPRLWSLTDLHLAHVSGRTAGYATALPVAVYLLALWALHLRSKRGLGVVLFPVAAGLVLVAPWLPAPIHVIAGLLGAVVALTLIIKHRAATRTP